MVRNQLSGHRLTFRLQDWYNTRWYDISRGVTTCGEEAADGNGHQPAWTSVVKHWYKRLHVQPGFIERTFIDIGCGKGKVMLAWLEQLENTGISQQVVGLESDREMADQARVNMHKRGYHAPIYTTDAVLFPYRFTGNPLILWLFNSFGEDKVHELADALEGTDSLLVYHNPQHAHALIKRDWWALSIQPGVHEKNTSMLLTNKWPA